MAWEAVLVIGSVYLVFGAGPSAAAGAVRAGMGKAQLTVKADSRGG
ncbi:hypothetical protein GCM10007285_04340 [Stappia taiwanensis]|nr:hypothetical protein GCM10007285_04340 [Stappia taiwanensis]